MLVHALKAPSQLVRDEFPLRIQINLVVDALNLFGPPKANELKNRYKHRKGAFQPIPGRPRHKMALYAALAIGLPRNVFVYDGHLFDAGCNFESQSDSDALFG